MEDKKEIILRTENVTKVFGGLRAIHDVSIHLYKNEILGLIGANGAGKTTMFNMISGNLPMTSGKLYLNEKHIPRPTPHKMAKLGIGRTYQIVQPFSDLTVLENTMVGAFINTSDTEKAREKAAEVLNTLGLAHKANIPGKELALIDLKRMELARALAMDPEILMLDEVMAGLTIAESTEVIEMIRGIQKMGVSIIIIEHVMRAVMGLCERIYVLNQGKLIAEGTPEQISNNQQVIESYLGVKKDA